MKIINCKDGRTKIKIEKNNNTSQYEAIILIIDNKGVLTNGFLCSASNAIFKNDINNCFSTVVEFFKKCDVLDIVKLFLLLEKDSLLYNKLKEILIIRSVAIHDKISKLKKDFDLIKSLNLNA